MRHDKGFATPQRTVVLLFAKARDLECLNNAKEALETYNLMITKYENEYRVKIDTMHQNGKLFLYLAVAYMKCGKDLSCDTMYNQYLLHVDRDKVGGNDLYAIASWCRLLWILQRNDEAWTYLTKAAAANHKDPFIYYYQGVILRERGRFDQATDSFDRSINLIYVHRTDEMPSYHDTHPIQL